MSYRTIISLAIAGILGTALVSSDALAYRAAGFRVGGVAEEFVGGVGAGGVYRGGVYRGGVFARRGEGPGSAPPPSAPQPSVRQWRPHTIGQRVGIIPTHPVIDLLAAGFAAPWPRLGRACTVGGVVLSPRA